ncbi:MULTISPECIES: molybdopterin-dependent oxidoreductase [Actinomadura]|uniref:DMSO/TMAO reductase YedYZ molybdopterin-dependent catalytic subunit n=1 Tax=Actinomadura livida TaxID=79909 RepID=A0A7W7IBE9_9ACTN|nr:MULTISPECIES: molybdopterin-dependent oxidoreductase [Actinomadura]MBB4773895.1 DMSO/TMAO reductase YedYZ molybdopterin-dependent catalytic subunit [Actinomadura catellatispora]
MNEEDRTEGSPVGRRVVLGMLGLGAAGVAVGASVQDGVSRALAPVGPIGDVLPAAGGFRYYSVTGRVKRRSAATHRVTVGGLVDKPQAFGMADLARFPQTVLERDFQCVTGWRVPDVEWVGVVLADLLDAVGVSPKARAVQFTSFDGVYTESLTLEQARRRDVLVATQMEGKPVTHDHGGPTRLYVAPMYGYKSLKWLKGIKLTEELIPGYWEGLGYDQHAWVGKSNGRDDVPT